MPDVIGRSRWTSITFQQPRELVQERCTLTEVVAQLRERNGKGVTIPKARATSSARGFSHPRWSYERARTYTHLQAPVRARVHPATYSEAIAAGKVHT